MRVETDTANEQDEVKVDEETTTQAASEIEKSGDASDAENDTEGVVESDVAASEDTCSDDVETEYAESVKSAAPKRRIKWSRLAAFWVLPVLALVLAVAAGFLKWQDFRVRQAGIAGIESVAAAKESTVALLSYQPDSVEKDLGAARDRLTGKFKDSYTQLVHDVVIPGAKKDHIAAVATVPAAASVSATPNHAVALVFVDQTVTVGNDAPTDTASAVRVTLDKIGDRWLISAFDPV